MLLKFLPKIRLAQHTALTALGVSFQDPEAECRSQVLLVTIIMAP